MKITRYCTLCGHAEAFHDVYPTADDTIRFCTTCLAYMCTNETFEYWHHAFLW